MKGSILLIIVLLTVPVFGQKEDKPYKTTALNFEANFISLSSVYGGIGGKTWLSDSYTLVASVGGRYSSSTIDAAGNITKSEQTRTSVILNFGFEKHFQMADNISPYLSARFSGSYDRNTLLPSRDTTYSQDDIKESKESTYGVGLNIGFGVELWLTNRISLSGQHLFSANYSWGTSVSLNADSPDRDKSSFRINSGTSAIILAIYF